jgi:hypothetical protein
MYVPCTTTSHVHMLAAPLHPRTLTKSAKNKNCKGIRVFGPLPNHLTAHSQSPNRILSFWPIKEGVGVPFQKRKHESKETLPISVFPLCPNILQPHCEFEPEFPFSALFPPLQTLAISLERTEEEKNTWKQLVHGEEEPRTEFEEQLSVSYCKRLCEINIKKYFFRPAK